MCPCCCCCCYFRAAVRCLHWSAFSSQRECVWQLTRFGGRKWRSGVNRISHPDWVKLSVELNCAPNQNTKVFSSLQLLSIYIIYSADRKTRKTFIRTTLFPRLTSADESGYKAIKFATHPLYFLDICLCTYIVLSSSSSELKVYLLMWENIWGPLKKDHTTYEFLL